MSDSGVAALISLYRPREPAFVRRQLPGHVASTTKPLSGEPEQHTETPFTFPPERSLFIYLHFDVLSNC